MNIFDSILNKAKSWLTSYNTMMEWVGSKLYDVQQNVQLKQQGNVIQAFLNESKAKPEMQSKRNAVIQMIQNGEDDSFIQDTIVNKMGYSSEVWIGGRIGSALWNRLRIAWESYMTDKSAFEKWLSATKDVIATPFDILGASIQPVVEPIIKPVLETAPVQAWMQAYGQFREANPRLAQNIEAWVWIGTAFLPFTKAWQTVGKIPWQVATAWAKKLAQVAPKVTKPIKNVGQTIWQKYQWARQYLAWLSEQEIWAIEKTSARELDDIIRQAKLTQGKKWDYVQTPYHVWASKAQKTLNQLEKDLKTRQSERLMVLDEAPIAKIDATESRMALKSALHSMNVEDIRIVDGKPEIIPVKWREALLDLSNPADVKALQKLNEILDWDVSPTQTMDRIKKLQEWAYENKSTIGVKGTSERMDWLIKRVQGSLNATFKKQLPPEYAKILDSMSDDIKLSNEVKRVFWIDDMWNPVWNRGELVMKRLANGTTTGGEARTLAKQIFDRYGIDLVKEARLRQMAMDLVWDDRWHTLFGAIARGKSGIMDLAIQKTLGKIVNKEWVVRSLARWKPEVMKKSKPLYTPNAFRKAMAEEARKPKALPAPSGKELSAKEVWIKPMTGSPKTDGMTGQRWKTPWTSKVFPKQETKLLTSWYAINKNWERILLNPQKNSIIEESKKGLSPNIKRPNGTPLWNNKNSSSNANTQWSKQKVKKPSPTATLKQSQSVVVPEKSKKLSTSQKNAISSEWEKKTVKTPQNLLKKEDSGIIGGMNKELIQEARKYKSAEEFVNSYELVYHWSKSDIWESTLRVWKWWSRGSAVYTTKNIEQAKRYWSINERYISKDAKVFDFDSMDKTEIVKKISDWLKKLWVEHTYKNWLIESKYWRLDFEYWKDKFSLNSYLQWLKKDGISQDELFKKMWYDIAKMWEWESQIMVYNPNVLKTKSQLKQIYENVHNK